MYGVSIIFLLYLHLFVLKKGKPEKEPEVADPTPEGEVGVQVISSNSLGISDKHLTDSGKTHRQTNGSFTYFYSAGIDLSRQNLASVDVRF